MLQLSILNNGESLNDIEKEGRQKREPLNHSGQRSPVNMRVRPSNSGEDPLTVANNYCAGNINLCGKITRRKSGWCTRGTPVCHITGVYIACTRCIDVTRCCNLRFVVAGETRSFSRLWFRRKRRFSLVSDAGRNYGFDESRVSFPSREPMSLFVSPGDNSHWHAFLLSFFFHLSSRRNRKFGGKYAYCTWSGRVW